MPGINGATIYLGGKFTHVMNTARNRLAAVTDEPLPTLSGWNPADAAYWHTEVAARTYPADGPFADDQPPRHELGVIASPAG